MLPLVFLLRHWAIFLMLKCLNIMITSYKCAVRYENDHECCQKYLKLVLDVIELLQNGTEWPLTTNSYFVCNKYMTVSLQNWITVSVLMLASSFQHSFWFVDFVSLIVLLLYVPSQQLWSWQDCQFTLPHFFLGKLEQAVNQNFVHILSLVTDNNPSWMIQRKGGDWP